MAMAGNEHEESRRLQIEENKKRMQELGLLDFEDMFNTRPNNTPTKRKPKQETEQSEAQAQSLVKRRSARTAAKPPVDYKHGYVPACRYIGASAADFAIVDAIEKALSNVTNPVFIRPVLYSYGAGSYRAYIPMAFRDSHMPQRDERFIVEDEDQLKWKMSFDSKHGDLIQGWRAFNTHHALAAGDCCLFELVKPLRFRVQIFRYDEYKSKKKGSGKKPKEENSLSRKRKNQEPEDEIRKVGNAVDRQIQCTQLTKQGPVLDNAIVMTDIKPKVEGLDTHLGYRSPGIGTLDVVTVIIPKLEGNETAQCCKALDGREATVSVPLDTLDRKPKLETEPLHGSAFLLNAHPNG